MSQAATDPSTRRVEIFSAGCPACARTVDELREAIDPRHQVVIRDMHEQETAGEAETLGIRTVPAVVVDGSLLACCRNTGPTFEELQAAGLTRA